MWIKIYHFACFVAIHENLKCFELHLPQDSKYWVDVQQGQLYLMVRMCLFSIGWPPF